jgi:hypothetical protein
MSSISKEEQFDAKVVKLMKMSGGPNDPSIWTRNQIFFGLGKSSDGITKEDVGKSIERLIEFKSIKIIEGKDNRYYSVRYGANYPQESKEDMQDKILARLDKLETNINFLTGAVTGLKERIDALELSLFGKNNVGVVNDT